MPIRFIPFFNPKKKHSENPTHIQVSWIEAIWQDGSSVVCLMKDDGSEYTTEFDSEQEASENLTALISLLNHE